jgi:hypothetical protein
VTSTYTRSGWEFELDGHQFFYDEHLVWTRPGEFHADYLLYARCDHPADEPEVLWEARRLNAAREILLKWPHWVAQADDRRGIVDEGEGGLSA